MYRQATIDGRSIGVPASIDHASRMYCACVHASGVAERVRVETQRHIIEGTLQLPHEGYRSRTTDYLNAHDSDFIALIDADVRWADGSREPERQDYLAISARHIILVTELESLGVVEEPNPALGVN